MLMFDGGWGAPIGSTLFGQNWLPPHPAVFISVSSLLLGCALVSCLLLRYLPTIYLAGAQRPAGL